MKKRIILYILCVVGVVVLNCLYVDFEFMLMLIMILAIPLFSYLIFLISRHGLKLFVKITDNVISVEDDVDIRIVAETNLIEVPDGKIMAQIRYSNDTKSKPVEVEIGGRSGEERILRFRPEHIGVVSVYFTELKVTDYIRFFSATYDYNCIRKAIVFPVKSKAGFSISDYQNEEDEYILSFEETDNTEVLDLRKFTDGDSVNKIHWKLSMNSDDFIVRQYGDEVEKRNTIIVDLTKLRIEKFRDNLDLIYKAAYLLGLAYIDDGISARFVVWDSREYDVISFDFDDESGLEKALADVMNIKCTQDSLVHLNYIILQNSINLGQYPVLITMQDYESDIYDIINVTKDNLDEILNIKPLTENDDM